MLNIKNCLLCGKKIKEIDSSSIYHYKIKKFCDGDCRNIVSEYNRYMKKHEKGGYPYIRGLIFELFVKRKLEQEGHYVIRSHNSVGIFDLVSFKNNVVYGFDLTTNELTKIKPKEILEFWKNNRSINIKRITVNEENILSEKDFNLGYWESSKNKLFKEKHKFPLQSKYEEKLKNIFD